MPSIDTAQVALAYRASHLQKGSLIVWCIFAFVFLCWSIILLAFQLLHRRFKFNPPRLPYVVLLVAVVLNFAACIAAVASNVIDGTHTWFVTPTSFIAAGTTFDLAQAWAKTALFVAVCLAFFALHDPLGRPGRWGLGVAYGSSKFVFAFYAFAMFAIATAAGAMSGDVMRKLRNVLLGAPVVGNSIFTPGSPDDMASILKENKAANDLSLYVFPALFVASSLFVIGYAVSFFRAFRRSAPSMPGQPVNHFYSKAFVAMITVTYMTFAAAVFIFIFLFKFLKPTSEIDNGDLQRKLGLASSIIYNFLFNNITLMLMLLAIKWPTYVWAPETSAEAAPEPVPVPLVPTVPLAENTAAVEEHRAVAEERAHEEQPEVVRTSV